MNARRRARVELEAVGGPGRLAKKRKNALVFVFTLAADESALPKKMIRFILLQNRAGKVRQHALVHQRRAEEAGARAGRGATGGMGRSAGIARWCCASAPAASPFSRLPPAHTRLLSSKLPSRHACVPRHHARTDRFFPFTFHSPSPQQTRLAKYYIPLDDADKRTLEYDVHRATAGRDPGFAAVADYKGAKLIFRRYAGLYFTLGADAADNELVLMEAIHLFVEVRERKKGVGVWRPFFICALFFFPYPSLFSSLDPGPLLWQRVRAGPGVQLSQGER